MVLKPYNKGGNRGARDQLPTPRADACPLAAPQGCPPPAACAHALGAGAQGVGRDGRVAWGTLFAEVIATIRSLMQ